MLYHLYFWNGTVLTPILPCVGCTHDTAGNRIVALLDHLTEFALLGKQSEHKVHLPLVQR